MVSTASTRLWRSSLTSAIAVFLAVSSVHAQGKSFQDGQRLYAGKQYKQAIAKFSETARDASSQYYIALCYHQMGDMTQAKKAYAEAVALGGAQAPAMNALKALNAIDPAFAKAVLARSPRLIEALSANIRSSGGSHQSGGSQAIDTSLPSEGRFDIAENPAGASDGRTYVSATVNGRNMKMLFDTGAEMVLFDKTHFRDLGLPAPSGSPATEVRGVGGTVPAWRTNINLKVGTIERRNFPVLVQDSMNAPPLLGQSFFREYQVQMDKRSNMIRLVRNDMLQKTTPSPLAATSMYNVPFTRLGNLMVVQVQVNGRDVQMCLDTGASSSQFTKEQLSRASITVPQDASTGSTQGVGGMTTRLIFPVNRMKMGPIDRSDYNISLVGAAHMPYPLLGQDFFGDWRYSIDSVNNMIKFHSH